MDKVPLIKVNSQRFLLALIGTLGGSCGFWFVVMTSRDDFMGHVPCLRTFLLLNPSYSVISWTPNLLIPIFVARSTKHEFSGIFVKIHMVLKKLL